MKTLSDVFEEIKKYNECLETAKEESQICNDSQKIFTIIGDDTEVKKIVRESIVGNVISKSLRRTKYYEYKKYILIEPPYITNKEDKIAIREQSNAIEVAQFCIFIARPEDITKEYLLGIKNLSEEDNFILKDKKVILCIEHSINSLLVPYPSIIDDACNVDRESIFNAIDKFRYEETFKSFVEENTNTIQDKLAEKLSNDLKYSNPGVYFIFFTNLPNSEKYLDNKYYREFQKKQNNTITIEYNYSPPKTLPLLDWEKFLKKFTANCYLKYSKALDLGKKEIENANSKVNDAREKLENADIVLDNIMASCEIKELSQDDENQLMELCGCTFSLNAVKSLLGQEISNKDKEKIENILKGTGYYDIINKIKYSFDISGVDMSLGGKVLGNDLYNYIKDKINIEKIKENTKNKLNEIISENLKKKETTITYLQLQANNINKIITICDFLNYHDLATALISQEKDFEKFKITER